MPHIVLDGPVDLKNFCADYKPVSRQIKGEVLKLQNIFISPDSDTVLIEALASNLPVLVTEVCGYSFHIERAEAGKIIPAPFKQETLNKLLAFMLTAEEKKQWKLNAGAYFAENDLFSLSEKAADVIEQVVSC